MTYQKIGFLTGVGGNPTGIGDYVNELDAAGRPAICFSNDDIAGVDDILKRWEAGSSVNHVAAHRVVKDGSEKYAVPNYTLDPPDAATAYFNLIEPLIHPRVKQHKDKVWIFLGNELDKNRSDWLGRWAENSATLWNFHDYRVALFGFASGEPEVEHWEEPGMLAFLRLAAHFPDQIAVNLHEYSYEVDDILDGYPYKVGRFQFLFDVCDKHNIPRPTVLIGEWGWQDRDLPSAGVATAEISDVSNLYGQFPTVLGAGIWYLGPGFDGIANKAQRLIAPVTELSKPWAQGEFSEDLVVEPGGPEPPPAKTFEERAWWVTAEMQINNRGGLQLNPSAGIQQRIAQDSRVGDLALQAVTTEVGVDDKVVQAAESLTGKVPRRVYVYEPGVSIWYFENPEAPPPPDGDWLYPVRNKEPRITHPYGEPRDYDGDGVKEACHEGVDLLASTGDVIVASRAGEVVWSSNQRRSGGPSQYGEHIIIDHGDGHFSWYCHLFRRDVNAGFPVAAGQEIGLAGSSGNSTGPHLHFNIEQAGYSAPACFVLSQAIDPAPLLGLEPPPTEEINLLPYIRGDGRLYEVRNADGGQERFQTQVEDTGNWYQTKNQNWEQFFLLHDLKDGNDYICRDIDTSPGGGRYYRLKDDDLARGSRWGKAVARVGETWEQARHVQFYNISDCSKSTANSGYVVDMMRFVAHYETITFRTGFTLQDVVQLEWVNGSEFYWYAKDYGLVAWERKHPDPNSPAWSAISEEHAPGARPDNERLVIPCL